MTTKLKKFISAIIITVFMVVSSFVLPTQNVSEIFQKSDTISSHIETNTEDNKSDENETIESTKDSKDFTMMSLNIVYYLFYKYLHKNDFNN